MKIVDLFKIGSKKPEILGTQGKQGCISLSSKMS